MQNAVNIMSKNGEGKEAGKIINVGIADIVFRIKEEKPKNG